MKASALNDLDKKGETMDHDQIVGLEICEDTGVARVNLSDDEKSISLIDKTGSSKCLAIFIPERVESRKHPTTQTFMIMSYEICPYCRCLKISQDGESLWYNPQTRRRCEHGCNHI